MKQIVRIAVIAASFSAGAAWSQESREQMPQSTESTEASVAVAHTSDAMVEAAPVARDAAKPRGKMSFHEWTGLAGDGAFPSRGGPIDD